MKDFHYIKISGMVVFSPNNTEAEDVWRSMESQYGTKFFDVDFPKVKAQLKAAGYSVGKTPKMAMSDAKLLGELGL